MVAEGRCGLLPHRLELTAAPVSLRVLTVRVVPHLLRLAFCRRHLLVRVPINVVGAIGGSLVLVAVRRVVELVDHVLLIFQGVLLLPCQVLVLLPVRLVLLRTARATFVGASGSCVVPRGVVPLQLLRGVRRVLRHQLGLLDTAGVRPIFPLALD